MSNSSNPNEILEKISQVLIRCFIMGVFVLLIWVCSLTLIGDLAYNVHIKIVPMSREQFHIINYDGLITLRTTIFVLFLIPYITIRLVIKKRGK
jgi:hypothetical protein